MKIEFDLRDRGHFNAWLKEKGLVPEVHANDFIDYLESINLDINMASIRGEFDQWIEYITGEPEIPIDTEWLKTVHGTLDVRFGLKPLFISPRVYGKNVCKMREGTDLFYKRDYFHAKKYFIKHTWHINEKGPLKYWLVNFHEAESFIEHMIDAATADKPYGIVYIDNCMKVFRKEFIRNTLFKD